MEAVPTEPDQLKKGEEKRKKTGGKMVVAKITVWHIFAFAALRDAGGDSAVGRRVVKSLRYALGYAHAPLNVRTDV